MARKRRFNRRYGRKKRVRYSKRGGKRFRAKRKLRRVAKKLKSQAAYGPRLNPRSVIVKMRWFQDYMGDSTGGVVYTTGTDNGKSGVLFVNAAGYYHKRLNLTSLMHPDILATSSGQTHSAYNWKEFGAYYTKWFVRACKFKMWVKAQQTNGNTSLQSPMQVAIWCDNNNNNNVATMQQAMIQPGVKYMVIDNSVYAAGKPNWVKGYYKAKKVLKRQIDESVDFGNIYNTGVGTDPPDNSCMFLHILFRGGAWNTEQQYMTFGIILKQYAKFWDILPDEIDELDPNA